jgi:hypothetical protein
MADFRREAAAMLRVPPHPNVLQLVGVSAAPPLALVTDFCPGVYVCMWGGCLGGLAPTPRLRQLVCVAVCNQQT